MVVMEIVFILQEEEAQEERMRQDSMVENNRALVVVDIIREVQEDTMVPTATKI